MARPSHYSPAISRFLVTVLYHEAKPLGEQLIDEPRHRHLSTFE